MGKCACISELRKLVAQTKKELSGCGTVSGKLSKEGVRRAEAVSTARHTLGIMEDILYSTHWNDCPDQTCTLNKDAEEL